MYLITVETLHPLEHRISSTNLHVSFLPTELRYAFYFTFEFPCTSCQMKQNNSKQLHLIIKDKILKLFCFLLDIVLIKICSFIKHNLLKQHEIGITCIDWLLFTVDPWTEGPVNNPLQIFYSLKHPV